MMLSTLQDIADAEGILWLWGDKAAFDKLVLDTSQDTEPIILYHEGFVSGMATVDMQGALDPSYNVRLCLLTKSNFADSPRFRSPRFLALEPIMYRVLKQLQVTHRITGSISITEGINQTSTNLDGIRFSFNAVPKVPVAVCITKPVVALPTIPDPLADTPVVNNAPADQAPATPTPVDYQTPTD